MGDKKSRGSMRKAIDEKCKDCSYDNLDVGTWRNQVERCPSKKCALWPHRPVSHPKSKQNTPDLTECGPV
jgi:hypothetical protein